MVRDHQIYSCLAPPTLLTCQFDVDVCSQVSAQKFKLSKRSRSEMPLPFSHFFSATNTTHVPIVQLTLGSPINVELFAQQLV